MAAPVDENACLDSEVFRNKYRFIKSIGKGSFGEALLVRSKTNGKRYAVKAIDSKTMTTKEKRDVQNEIRIMAAVNHPNIIRYHEHFEDGSIIFIIMEYADGGDLSSRIKEAKKSEGSKPFEPKLAMFWFLQICMALKYLHDNHILHRDLKTANVFLTSKNVVKLGDFGISTVLQNTMACAKTVCGTPYYFSPELCQNKPYNNKSDVWALGVVFYEMLTLHRPFTAKSLKELLKKILVGQYDPIPSSVPAEMRALCASLLQVNPVQRPSINRILESSFVQDSLKGFSSDLERQAEKDRAEYEARHPKGASEQKATPAAAAPPENPAPPQLSEREQMAMLRGMNREQRMKAIAQTTPEAGAAPTQPKETGHPDVDDDGDYIAQKNAIVRQTKDIVGKTNLGGHPEEFGDGPSDSAPQAEMISLHNGQPVLASDVRRILEAEMGKPLLDKAVDIYNNCMMRGMSGAEVQSELYQVLGANFSKHSNAITKLAVWEGKQTVNM